MRRILLTAVTAAATALIAPGLAVAAHHGRTHRHAHHARARHHASPRVLHFGTALPAAPAVSQGSGPPSVQATSDGSQTSATVPATGAGADEAAGTVKSFTGGVLTITLKDGSTVSATVTEQTEIRCVSATPPPEGSENDEGGEESGGIVPPAPTARDASATAATEGEEGKDGQDGSDGEESDHEEGDSTSCTAAALVPETVVREAELSVQGSGATWNQIELVH